MRSCKDDEGTGASLVCREAERAGTHWLEKKRHRNFIHLWKYLMGRNRKDGANLVPNDRRKGNRHILKYRELRLKIRKVSFTARMVKYWKRLSIEGVKSSSLKLFKTSCSITETSQNILSWEGSIEIIKSNP